jgi:hypothetical protein
MSKTSIHICSNISLTSTLIALLDDTPMTKKSSMPAIIDFNLIQIGNIALQHIGN